MLADLLPTLFIIAFFSIFILVAAFMLIMMVKTLRGPKAAHTISPAKELSSQLACPKCGSRDLEPVGFYTIRCRTCGFTFSVGSIERPIYHPFWWFGWPFVWLIFSINGRLNSE